MKKILIIGCGNRALEMFIKPYIWNSELQIGGICDVNKERIDYIRKYIPYPVKCYVQLPEKNVLKEYDYCVITTRDCFHADIILKLQSVGISIICEKPIATSIEQCQKLMSIICVNHKIKIAFNSRYMPINEAIKKIISAGVIGKIKQINYNWYINKKHGAEYFRRWHRKKKESGGLLVHKSCHHFDLVNWWIEDYPVKVQAINTLSEFGGTVEEKLTCRKCNYNCKYRMTKEKQIEFENMYFKCERGDKFLRDGCVYAKEIDIEDIMNVHVKYSKGSLLNYSLVMFAESTHWDLNLIGENGEIRVNYNESSESDRICISTKNKVKIEKIEKNNKKHEGADENIRRYLFGKENSSLDLRAGINSVIIGLLGEISSSTGKIISVDDYLENWNG